MHDLRTVRLERLSDAADETQRLLAGGYVAHGNWSLGQMCRHLRLVQDSSVLGYPKWMSFFAFVRPVMRHVLLPRVLSHDPPRGIRTLGTFEPGEQADDREEVERFAGSIDRFLNHPGEYHPHPAFGRLSRERLEQVHAAHAAHHLRFLEPKVNPGGSSE